MQHAHAGGRTVAQSIIDAAAAVNHDALPKPGSVGVVVGAALSDPPDVSGLGGPVLVPGVGAQGGRPEALGGLGGALPGQLLPAVSREVLRAGPDVWRCGPPPSGCVTSGLSGLSIVGDILVAWAHSRPTTQVTGRPGRRRRDRLQPRNQGPP